MDNIPIPQPTPPRPGQTIPGQQDVLNIDGFVSTFDFVPTAKPRQFLEQFVIVTAGGSSRFYMYDRIGLAWKYTALT